MVEPPNETEPTQPGSLKEVSMAEFLQSCPPNQRRRISNITTSGVSGHDVFWTPDIRLYCDHADCEGVRTFRVSEGYNQYASTEGRCFFMEYKCSNCQRRMKTFSVVMAKDSKGSAGEALKIGEVPPFGPPTPPRLIKLIGPDRALFLQGRRCENQGLGIGAFVYYRRVVEDQKSRILSEILKVARKVGADDAAILELESAVKETRFTEALNSVRHGIPESLLINGENPLLLLHDALSRAVHALSDSECLDLATAVRLVLMDLAERLSQALKDDAELNAALTKLTALRNKQSST
jgi:hypothetical protein